MDDELRTKEKINIYRLPSIPSELCAAPPYAIRPPTRDPNAHTRYECTFQPRNQHEQRPNCEQCRLPRACSSRSCAPSKAGTLSASHNKKRNRLTLKTRLTALINGGRWNKGPVRVSMALASLASSSTLS